MFKLPRGFSFEVILAGHNHLGPNQFWAGAECPSACCHLSKIPPGVFLSSLHNVTSDLPWFPQLITLLKQCASVSVCVCACACMNMQ